MNDKIEEVIARGETLKERRKSLSPEACDAISWLMSSENEDFTAEEARAFILKTWGQEVEDELKDYTKL